MRINRSGLLIYLVLFLTVLSFLPPEKAGAKEAKKIDFSATLDYIRNWKSRDTFPDSPSLAYENTYCRLALEGRISDSDKKRIIEFLKKCQRPDGGFTANPDLKEGSNVIFTYFALATLDLISAPSSVDGERAVQFVLSLVQKDGGIKAKAEDRAANLGTTYYGLRSLYLLKALDRIDKSRTLAYIESYRDDGKGFGVLAGKPSAPRSTFMAVAALKLLGGLSDEMRPGLIRFLKDSPYSGLREPGNPALMSIDDEADVLETAALLSAVQQLNVERIHEYVESLYIPENGGFGPSTGLGSTPPGTYYAIVCLVKLGKLKDPYSLR